MTAKDLIKSTRIAKGLSQTELAERTGFTKAQISRHEAGQNITEDTLNRYAIAFGAKCVDIRFTFEAKKM